jgi:hypothetical protein
MGAKKRHRNTPRAGKNEGGLENVVVKLESRTIIRIITKKGPLL